MVSTWFTVQGDDLGTAGAVLSMVRTLAAKRSYGSMLCTFAYGSRRGAADLLAAFAGTSCDSAEKRWLIGIDFGRTEPAALEYLSKLTNSAVRVPHGHDVVGRPGFIPRKTFHPKGIVFYDPSKDPAALLVGSANLTRNGLSAGTEMTVAYQWPKKLSKVDRQILARCKPGISLMEKLWRDSAPVDEILDDYKQKWRASPRSRRSVEDDVPDATERQDLAGVVIHGVQATLVASARALWTAPGGVSRNRGAGRAGSQLDLPRGSRVFFGFTSAAVPRNSTFGDVLIQVPGYSQVSRTVRFGNNSMDKVNLPIPGTAGPPGGYHNDNLLFTRQDPDVTTGRERFLLEVLTDRRLATKRAQAADEVLLDLSGSSRRVGLLF